MKKKLVNSHYLPSILSTRDKKKKSKKLLRSSKLYKKGKYYTRKKLLSFKSKLSPHIINAKKKYNVNTIGATIELSKKTGCTKKSLSKIINKGKGAYYSSGSRPNQTPQSWGIARLASSITAGKSGAVDYDIF